MTRAARRAKQKTARPTLGPLTPQALLRDTVGILDERDKQHGPMIDDARRLARMWNTYLDGRADPSAKISPHDVVMMRMLSKIVRMHGGENIDNYYDAAGYIAHAAFIAKDD